jgi:serine protease Do
MLSSRIGLAKAGDKVTLEVWRDKKARTIVATLGSTEDKVEVASRGEPADGARLGLALRPLNRDERGEVGEQGLLVENVDGAAKRAGVAPGDVVLAVNGKPVTSVDDVKSIMASKPKRVALLVWREGNRIFVPVNLG